MDDPTTTAAGQSFLRRVRNGRLGASARAALPPVYGSPSVAESGLVDRFIARLESVGGCARRTDLARLQAVLDELGAVDLRDDVAASPAAPPEVCAVRGVVASAEDAAIYVPAVPKAEQRALPWLSLHLVVVLAADAVVADLHAAFAHPEVRGGLGRAGMSSWISGPSKTADIEQTLVMGAHGPQALTVLLVDGPS